MAGQLPPPPIFKITATKRDFFAASLKLTYYQRIGQFPVTTTWNMKQQKAIEDIKLYHLIFFKLVKEVLITVFLWCREYIFMYI